MRLTQWTSWDRRARAVITAASREFPLEVTLARLRENCTAVGEALNIRFVPELAHRMIDQGPWLTGGGYISRKLLAEAAERIDRCNARPEGAAIGRTVRLHRVPTACTGAD